MSGVTVRINMQKLEAAPRIVEEFADQLIHKTAVDVRHGAQDKVPVDTGATKHSMYVAMRDESDYASAATQAEALRPGVTILGEVHPDEDMSAVVGVGTNYAAALEFGTSRMPARPYLVPALEAMRQPFLNAWRALQERLG